MRLEGRAISYQNATQRILQQALRDAVIAGHNVPAGTLMVKNPKTAKTSAVLSSREAIPVEAAKRMVAVAWRNRGTVNPTAQDGSRWLAALLQGMRQGECLGLLWDNVDFDGGLIHIDWQLQELKQTDGKFILPAEFDYDHLDGQYFLTRPKSGAGIRTIPMIEPMYQALKEWQGFAPKNPWGLVWPSVTGRPKYRRTDRSEWRALQDAANVEKTIRVGSKTIRTHYVLHEARNTTASLLLEANVPPKIIVAIMGHADIETSERYMTVTTAEKKKAIESVSKLLEM